MNRALPFAGLSAMMALSAAAAPLAAGSHPFAALALRGFFSRICDQDPARSFMVMGSPVAVCVRCLGLYCGVFAGTIMGPTLPMKPAAALRFFAAAVAASLLDAAAESCHLHGNLPLLRFALGVFLGFASGALMTLRQRRPPESAG